MKPEIRELLEEAVDPGGAAVFRSTLQLQPGTGWNHPVLRAAVYADGSKTWDPDRRNPGAGPVVSKIEREGRQIFVAIVESVEARAHDMTLALRRALEQSGAGVPRLELYRGFDGQRGVDLIADSWEVPHRVADPYWRDANMPEPGVSEDQWKRFFDTPIGEKLNPAKPIDPAVLLCWYPTALLFGFDPRAAILSAQSGRAARNTRGRGRRGAEKQAEETDQQDEQARPQARSAARPLGRLCRSEIVAEISGFYWRTQSLRRPLPAMSDAVIYQKADGDWTLSEDEAVKDSQGNLIRYPAPQGTQPGRASSIGLDDVTPSVRAVPDVFASKVTLTSYVSLAGIRNLRFSSMSQEQARAARQLLMAMGITAILGAEKDLHIRSDCELVLDDSPDAVVREIAYTNRHRKPRGVEDFGYDESCELLAEVAGAAREAGVWELPDPNPVVLVARPELLKLLGPTPGSEGEE